MIRPVAAIILEKEGKILLQLRGDDAPTNPGRWSFFGGGIEKGESEEEAVKRECFEELNYKLRNPKLILKENVIVNEKTDAIMSLFLEKYKEDQKLKLNEGKDMQWFAIEEALKLNLSKGFLPIMKKVKIN
jgi:8-oxo-dGTP diphosphatase